MTLPSLTELIPHRPPFLLLAELLSLTTDKVEASASVATDDPLYQLVYAGHYPEQPITPGVLLLEMIFQAGAALMANRLRQDAMLDAAGAPLLTRILDAKFRTPVMPDSKLIVTAEFDEAIMGAFILNGAIHLAEDKKLVVKTRFACTLAKV